jgi:hypothetical protein
VVAHAAGVYLFDEQATEDTVARAHACSRRTVGRWLRWLMAVVAPSAVAAEISQTAGAPVLAGLREVAGLSRKGRTAARRAMLIGAAQVLGLLEVLACARGRGPPGLQTLLGPALVAPGVHSTYRQPFIPDLARCLGPG